MSESKLRAKAFVGFMDGLLGDALKVPERPSIRGLSESAFLRIQAGVLDILRLATPNLVGLLNTFRELGTDHSIEALLDNSEDNAAKWLVTMHLRTYIGRPIFELVAGECLGALPLSEMTS